MNMCVDRKADAMDLRWHRLRCGLAGVAAAPLTRCGGGGGGSAMKHGARRREAEDRHPGPADPCAAVIEGAVERVRPKMTTVVAIMAGLSPIMWGTGTGAEVMSRIAAPMVGELIPSSVLTLDVIPALYALVKQWQLQRNLRSTSVPSVARAHSTAATPIRAAGHLPSIEQGEIR